MSPGGKIVTLEACTSVGTGPDKAWIYREWKKACDVVEIKALDVGFNSDRTQVMLNAARDGRNGSTAGVPAFHLMQPGAEHIFLGAAIRLKEEWAKLDAHLTPQKIIVGV